MTYRTMYDGINDDAAEIHHVFPRAEMIAYYIDSVYAWSNAEQALFPYAEHVTIATRAGVNDGDVLDVESGDATPDQTEGWIAMRKAAGLFRPSIYCNLSTVGAVRFGTGRFVLGVDWDLWVADWDGTTTIPYPHAAAKQLRDAGNFDVSAVYDAGWPHRTAPVTPAPKPAKPPAEPTNVHAHAITATDASISWTPVATAHSYRVRLTYQGNAVKSLTVANEWCTVRGLEPDHTYTTHVAAVNAAGISAETNGPEVRTPR